MLTSSAPDKVFVQKMRFSYPQGLTEMSWYLLYVLKLDDLV